jgi:hypothetical protein
VIEVYPKGFVPPHLARLRDKAARTSHGPAEQVIEEKSQFGVSSERGS